jgi:glycosyltransferase involved in cell wall biosynthesis
MSPLPRISVVTTSYNQGAFIGETIESVLAQNYPNVEHIVVDGMSTDDTVAVLSRYDHLRIIRERDKGAADAINKGFRVATGDIWCFLNSDDTLLPSALHRVAREIDPAAGRHVVMGRCRYVDEHGRFFGVEHPCHFESFHRVLEVWKGHCIPQPAVFWTPEVWKTCGPLDVGLIHFDYDLFCRFARRYRFHVIDQLLANYRLHSEAKTAEWSEAERLEDSIRLSRRYWGSPLLPMYWRLTLSLAFHRFNRTGRAQTHYRWGEELARHGHVLQALGHKALAGAMAPDVAFYAGVYSSLRKTAETLLDRVARPDSAVYRVIAPFRMDRLPILPGEAVRIEIDRKPEAIPRNSQFTLRPVLHNASGLDFRSVGANPVHLSYHWLAREGDDAIVFDGRRTALRPFLRSGETKAYEMTVDAPMVAGRFRLRVTLVQESVRWLDAPPESIFLDAVIAVQ